MVMLGKYSVYPTNTYCPTLNCSFPDFTSLAACTTCESKAIQTSRDLVCTVPSRVSKSRVESSCYGKQNDTTCLPLSFVLHDGDPRYLTLQGKGEAYQGKPRNRLRQPRSLFGNSRVLWRSDQQHNSTVAKKDRPLSFCKPLRLRRRDNSTSPSIGKFTCFTSTSDVIEIPDGDLRPFGNMGGILTQCRIDYCAKELRQVVMDNGITKIETLKMKPLTFQGRNANRRRLVYTAEVGGTDTEFVLTSMRSDILVKDLQDIIISRSFDEPLGELGSNQSWQTVFERMAWVITEYLRSSDNPSAHNHTGEAFGLQSTFEVQWAWLTLPVSIVLLSTLFLIITIVRSRREPYLFRNSILAAIFYGLEEWRVDELQDLDRSRTDSGLMKMATKMRATLVSDGDGHLKFSSEQ